MISLSNQIKFTLPEVGTATCIGQLFEQIPVRNKLNKNNELIDLLNLARYAEINDTLKSIKHYHQIKDNTYEKIIKDSIETVDEIITINRKPDFSHVVSFKIRISEYREVNVKICSNGSIQTTGIRSISESEQFLKCLTIVISNINNRFIENCGKVLYSHYLKPTITNISMIIYSFNMIFPQNLMVAIDLRKIYDHVASLPNFYVYYKKKVKSIEIMYDNIVYYIFQSGCINVTSVKSFESIKDSYNFIVNFLNKHIDKYIIVDMIQYSIDLVEQSKTSAPQKSQKWLEERLSCITASESAKLLNMSYETVILGKDENLIQNEFINEKVNAIITQKPKRISNEAMTHGVCFEPIARYVYELKIAKVKNAKVKVVELNLVKHQQHKYIGASPDGLVFLLNKNSDDKSSLQTLFNTNQIIDSYLIEIKCPFNYHPYYNNGTNIKCTNGYVPPYYWLQMQQQMFVCNLKHCDFINCKFTTYKNRQECLLDKGNFIQGVLLRCTNSDEVTFKYPSNYLMDIVSAENELLQVAESNDKFVYWRLEDATVTEVEYDKHFFENVAIPKLKVAYDLICTKVNKA